MNPIACKVFISCGNHIRCRHYYLCDNIMDDIKVNGKWLTYKVLSSDNDIIPIKLDNNECEIKGEIYVKPSLNLIIRVIDWETIPSLDKSIDVGRLILILGSDEHFVNINIKKALMLVMKNCVVKK